MLTNAKDMAKWIQMHLSKGVSEDGQHVVDESVLGDISVPVNLMNANPMFIRPTIPVTYVEDKYGLGMALGYYRGIILTVTTFMYIAKKIN